MVMTLEEAIRHCEEYADYDCYNEAQFECAKEHLQLAEWLKELKELREANERQLHCINRRKVW